MKKLFPALIAIALFGCAEPETESETLLVCNGVRTGPLGIPHGKDRSVFTIVKTGETITKVNTEHHTFTPEKIDVRTKEDKGPVYIQLIVDNDKLILRSEATVDPEITETILFNNGAYSIDHALTHTEGECTVSTKAF